MGIIDRFIDRDRPRQGAISVVERRARVMSTTDLASWADNTISHLGRSMRDFFSDGDPAHLDEVRVGTEALTSMVAELERRSGA